ncbi:ran-specific GTPase-activating protein-like [Ostrea edulis]|uniref:ran-specific GTPase-activating protein-like n=1 Tax=Ostrea edulis TaxID=37623 RepID=UPI002094E755|nr:ran-specific GTPase-activating protein-like [Ostrea edulis]
MADEKEEVVESPEIHFEPVVRLPEVEVKSLEEDEEETFKMRAKLFRFDNAAEPPEWKERGTGDVKLLKHNVTGLIRLLMRRDKTHKVCANHYVTTQMELKPNAGSDRAWVWPVPSDFADEEPKQELLAIRFANSENALKFKEKFEEAGKANEKLKIQNGLSETDEQKSERVGKEVTKQNETDDDKETSSMTEKLEELTVKGANSSDDKTPKDEGDSKDKPSDSNEAQGAQS